MASIKTSIELYDNFSDPMMDIVNAANAGTIAIENVQSAMNRSETFLKKSAGRPKFCYKEMELPIE